MTDYDVIVVGGGTAGVVAAIQSGRAGAKTLVVEKSGMPGGTMTSGSIACPGLFFAWRKQVIAGIGWELVTAAAWECGMTLPDFASQEGMKNHPAYQVKINPVIYAALCDARLLEAGVDILYHSMAAAVDGNTVTLCTKEGLKQVHGKVIVDCTGDANVVTLAGYQVFESGDCQPGTYSVRISGYDPKSLDYETIAANARQAVADGRLRFTDLSWNINDFSPQLLFGFGNNGNHLWGDKAHTSEGRSVMEIEGRQAILRAYRFLRTQPGLKDLKLELAASECGIRETVRIQGEKVITAEDYQSGRLWPDSICYAFYPIDLHNKEHGVKPVALPEGVVPTVPLGALIPKGAGNMLTAGRCISSDRLANSALRVQATCMATGQAAGAAAALAAAGNHRVSEVPLERLKELLKQHRAIVPGAEIADSS